MRWKIFRWKLNTPASCTAVTSSLRLLEKKKRKENKPSDRRHAFVLCQYHYPAAAVPYIDAMPCNGTGDRAWHLYASQGLSDPAGRCNQQSHSTGAINSLRSFAHCTADRDPRALHEHWAMLHDDGPAKEPLECFRTFLIPSPKKIDGDSV
jgi:hypothetical protein